MNEERNINLRYIHDRLDSQRFSTVDQDYLEYEVTMASEKE